MDNVLKINLKPKTSFLTPLRADTIFGHICWSILSQEGEASLVEFLELFKKNPIFLLSDGFISGYLPSPLMDIAINKEGKEDKIRLLDIHKKFKKKSLIKIEDLLEIHENGCSDEIMSRIADEGYYDDFINTDELVMKNSINRETGMVLEDGGLFSQQEYWSYSTYSVYVRIMNKELFDRYFISNHLESVFGLSGYGANKSTGKGLFDVSIEDFNDFDAFNSGRGLLLSHCILTDNERDFISGSDYKTVVKYGKLGEEKALQGNPFKRPLMQIKPGSILATDKLFVGGMVQLVDHNQSILDYNYGMLIRINL
ncbi:MAG: hypothetical protein BWY21_00622 [Parcubacteria group bacterium ADurb.Bin216]|nr:MAG: hypothetical protein BWY21_00622 [Parcubacteria group bacterium ADurb.Bin216]